MLIPEPHIYTCLNTALDMSASPKTYTKPLAIVGVSCRLPGGANDLDGLWGLLEIGAETVSNNMVSAAIWTESLL